MSRSLFLWRTATLTRPRHGVPWPCLLSKLKCGSRVQVAVRDIDKYHRAIRLGDLIAAIIDSRQYTFLPHGTEHTGAQLKKQVRLVSFLYRRCLFVIVLFEICTNRLLMQPFAKLSPFALLRRLVRLVMNFLSGVTILFPYMRSSSLTG